VNLKCLVLRHKWQPAEAANEAGKYLACQRCGKRTHAQGPGPRWERPNDGGPNFIA
jgi:hypothetical protein